MKFLGAVVLVALSGFFITLAVVQHFGQLNLFLFDRFDSRPPRDILVIGNSRTSANDMPFMVRAMADSAGSPEKLEIKVLAKDGYSLEMAWNDPDVQQALTAHWDTVVLQAESRAQSGEAERASFFQFAKMLAAKVQAAHTAFVVNWAYDSQVYPDGAEGRGRHVALIGSDFRDMSMQTGADLIYTMRAWELVRSARPEFSLYADENHPSVYGNYLLALTIYAYLSNSDGSAATYIPSPLTAADAALIKQLVAQALAQH